MQSMSSGNPQGNGGSTGRPAGGQEPKKVAGEREDWLVEGAGGILYSNYGAWRALYPYRQSAGARKAE